MVKVLLAWKPFSQWTNKKVFGNTYRISPAADEINGGAGNTRTGFCERLEGFEDFFDHIAVSGP